MKTLLKISCVFAFVLFISMSVKAQNTAQSGTITVNVPEKLELILSAQDVTFVQTYGVTAPAVTSTVQVKANVDWNFKISTNQRALTTTDGLHSINCSNILLSGYVTGLLTDYPTMDGTLDLAPATITWTLANLGNQFAGSYTAPVFYTLLKRL